LSLKYSDICSLAALVTSTIIFASKQFCYIKKIKLYLLDHFLQWFNTLVLYVLKLIIKERFVNAKPGELDQIAAKILILYYTRLLLQKS